MAPNPIHISRKTIVPVIPWYQIRRRCHLQNPDEYELAKWNGAHRKPLYAMNEVIIWLSNPNDLKRQNTVYISAAKKGVYFSRKRLMFLIAILSWGVSLDSVIAA